MAKEIERKFLVTNDSYRHMATSSSHIEQGYLSRDPEATVRVRVRDDRAFLTVKGRNHGMVRDEWEYPIPVGDARIMLRRCARGSILQKRRYLVPFEGFTWEVDEFGGDHAGLVVAEVELPSADTVAPLPPFVGEEVTGDDVTSISFNITEFVPLLNMYTDEMHQFRITVTDKKGNKKGMTLKFQA